MDYCKIIDNKLIKVWYIPDNVSADQIIPQGIKTIGERAFTHLLELEEIVVPDTVEEIEQFAFYNCPNLKKIDIGKNVKKVGYGAFGDCVQLEKITYSYDTEFEDFAFHNCKSLTYLDNREQKAVCFYLASTDSFAIAQPVNLPAYQSDKYQIYLGRLAANPFPSSPVVPYRSLMYFVVARDIKGEKCVYRSSNIEQAIKGSLYLASHLSYSAFFHRHIDENTILSWEDFALLTGICDHGEKIWNILIKTIPDTSVKEVLKVLQKYSILVYDRLKTAIDNQDKEYQLISFDKFLSDEEARNIIIKVQNNN